MFDRKNNNCGENICNPRKNIAKGTSVAMVTITNEELINSLLLADLGRYLIKFEFKPRMVKLLNNVIIEMRVVAMPTLSVSYRCAIIIQKTNPNPLNTSVLAILNKEFI